MCIMAWPVGVLRHIRMSDSIDLIEQKALVGSHFEEINHLHVWMGLKRKEKFSEGHGILFQ